MLVEFPHTMLYTGFKFQRHTAQGKMLWAFLISTEPLQNCLICFPLSIVKEHHILPLPPSGWKNNK
jgi:hypothetical protein